MNNELLKQACEASLTEIKAIIDVAKIAKCLDEQFFLDYLDKLNKFSIDPDREDTLKLNNK